MGTRLQVRVFHSHERKCRRNVFYMTFSRFFLLPTPWEVSLSWEVSLWSQRLHPPSLQESFEPHVLLLLPLPFLLSEPPLSAQLLLLSLCFRRLFYHAALHAVPSSYMRELPGPKNVQQPFLHKIGGRTGPNPPLVP